MSIAAGTIGQQHFFVDPGAPAGSPDAPSLPCQLEPDAAIWWKGTVRAVARAKAICRECPVRGACLEVALITDSDGVWGGKTKAERDLLLQNAIGSTATAA